jgi:hypothetical protein
LSVWRSKLTKFAKISGALENRLTDCGRDEEEREDEGGLIKKGLPEKREGNCSC